MAQEVDVVIVGAGISGLASAIYLKQAGIESFVLLEKGGEVGGTWRENTYPGAACDVPSHLYSFSFEPNPHWSHAFSPQAEILEYLKHCARKYGLLPHLRFHAQVNEAEFDEAQGKWTVRTRDGQRFRARALVLGNGALHLPAFPEIAGRERFQGTAFHSAQWRHDYDLTDKTVAVIGTGASAIQFVPQVAARARKLYLFQRNPPWILPRLDKAFSEARRRLFSRVPGLARLYRSALYWNLEWHAVAFLRKTWFTRLIEWVSRRHLEASVPDVALRARLTPRYRLGCKRVLVSDDYYPALNRPNVELVTEGIESIGPRGVRTRDGVEHEVDAIVYGTGFDVAHYLSPIRIVGREGRELNESWNGTPSTYLGITVSGFPNLFLLMGPNTGLGHNSMIFMIEAQARYAVQCIQALRSQDLRWLDVRPGVQAAFTESLREKMRETVWQTGGCRSWYQTPEGHNVTLWPGFTFDYWLRTRQVHLGDYTVRL
ncbi:flavin-containing monooxygenase [Hyalangium rubrum]|uniref:NAD(P)/FAD-dependent oxidoreductase n=1 Tax=Hyalangium rubrum TaxID=3103134 RepID=A0ABU5H3A3_9BACT|nr:NAD(P)/FAD-dependent oxidoreductase [Hyalangium sp. s54d21]MDY7227961.1 NAD(P)/FAD-dependent oxidoreductase [Hyalangium sp. s54d21]